MVLNLTITNPNSDYGRYHCVSKNEMGITRGDINVFGMIKLSSHCGIDLLNSVALNVGLSLFFVTVTYLTLHGLLNAVTDADPRFSGQPPGGHDDLKTWGPAPPDMTDLEVLVTLVCNIL